MGPSGQQLKMIITKSQLYVDVIFNGFDLDTLYEFEKGCTMLLFAMRTEKMLISSVHVKAMVLDDINQAEKNRKVIQSAINLKENKIANFCYN